MYLNVSNRYWVTLMIDVYVNRLGTGEEREQTD